MCQSFSGADLIAGYECTVQYSTVQSMSVECPFVFHMFALCMSVLLFFFARAYAVSMSVMCVFVC